MVLLLVVASAAGLFLWQKYHEKRAVSQLKAMDTNRVHKVGRTVVILKPDCMLAGLQGEVLNRFLRSGLKIVACKMILLDEAILKVHYAHHATKPFFPGLVKYMTSTPVIVLVLECDDAIQKVRDLLGPTDPALAPKGTIRGDFGKNKTENLVHASDSPEAAKEEMARFFKKNEILVGKY